jgi:hypothetical protein
MLLPRSNVGAWAKNLIDACYVSQQTRAERGARYRSMFLTGSMTGERQVYNLSYKHIDKLSSWLYSPVELRYSLDTEGHSSPADLAMARRASIALNGRVRRSGVSMKAATANLWGLVKGACLLKINWDARADRFVPHVVQPEMFGVLREDINELDRQEAFVHSTFYTPDRFREKIKGYPNAAEILKNVGKYIDNSSDVDKRPDVGGSAMQIVAPGLYPYQAAGTPGAGRGRGLVDWLAAPQAVLDPRVRNQLIRYDELWVWDDHRDDWTTIVCVGDVCVDGELRHRNLLGDPFDPKNPERSLPPPEDNPLHGHHPFVVFCPNELDGYFWGISEIELLSALQGSLNARVEGINTMLRLQEDPPRKFTGSAVTQKNYSAARKPGGLLTDSNPNAKMESLAPEIPAGLWESLHELEGMFRTMGGFTPTMMGQGDTGVRSNSQAESLISVGSPEIKDRALLVEESVSEVGGLCLDILRAKDATRYTAWLMPGAKSIVASIAANDEKVLEPPAEGMQELPFMMRHLPDDMACRVDSHSSSPAFSHETQQLMFALAKIGAASAEDVVQSVHPPREEALIAGIERREIAQAKMVQEHPELAFAKGGHKRK